MAEGAEPSLVERAEQVRKEIVDLQKQVKVRLDKVLAAQDRVGSLRIRILGWMSAAERADAVREQQLFEIEAKPIWAVLGRKEPGRDFGEQLRRLLQHNASALSAFLREEGTGLLWVLAIFVAVVAAVAWAGRRFAARAAVDPELAAPAEVLSHPISAGLLVALSLTSWLLPRAPAAFTELVVLVMLPPFLAIARNLLAPELRPPLYGFTALYAVARLGAIVPVYSLPGRLLMSLVAVVGLVGAFRLVRKGAPWTGAVKRPKRRANARIAVGILAALLLAGLVSNVVGNVNLGHLLVDGALSTAMIALLLAAVAQVLRALLVGGLRMPEFRRVFAERAGGAGLRRARRVVHRLGGGAPLAARDARRLPRRRRGEGGRRLRAHGPPPLRGARRLAGRPGRLRRDPLALGPGGPRAPGRARGPARQGRQAARRRSRSPSPSRWATGWWGSASWPRSSPPAWT